jgi:RNA polymerase sigma-70 factor (ECF subfamily)
MSEYVELALSHSPGNDTSSPLDEQIIVSRTLAGDLNAFNELVVKYQNLAYSIAYRMLQSREAAADAVQESLLKAYRGLPSFRNGSFKSWLIRIVINTCYDAIRISQRLRFEEIDDGSGYAIEEFGRERALLQISDPHESPDAFAERGELRDRIELGLRALPPEQRVVLILSDIHGYSYEDITQVTGVPMGTVKSRISRARLKLRDFLLQEPELLPFGSPN